MIFISVAYAFVNQTLFGTKRQVITSGNLELKLKEDESLTLENAMPMYDEVGMTLKPYVFTLANNSDNAIPYQLKLIDVTSSDNKLDTSIVKYGLTKNNKTTTKYLSNLIDGVMDTGKIQGRETIEYALRLWIDSSVEDGALIVGKTLSYKVEVEATQVVAKPNMPMMQKKINDTTAFYNYRTQITSIVFENKIDIPQTISDDKKWDVSAEAETGKVMAYIEETEDSTTDNPLYKLHIQGKNGVAANTDSSSLFSGFTKLAAIENMKYFDTSDVTRMYGMFNGCTGLTSLDLSDFDTSKVVDMRYMFKGCINLTTLDISVFDTSNVIGMDYMFNQCNSLTSLDLSSFHTPKLKGMFWMFADCRSLISLDVSNFDTSNITDMRCLFQNCFSLKDLDLSSFNTSNVTLMDQMFENCTSLVSINIKSLNTSNVTSMNAMFKNCSALMNLDLRNLDVSKVQNMVQLFYNCSSLTELNLSNLNTSNVTSMASMFYGCSSITTLDLGNFDTSQVTIMEAMFQNCSNLENLNLTSFDTSNVTVTRSMFQNCSNLIDLRFGEKTTFPKLIHSNTSYMFQNSNPTMHVKTQAQADWMKSNFPTLNIVIE